MLFSTAVGVVFIVLPPVFTLIYLRFTYIFLRLEKYRKLECYQLMIQIGLLDSLTAPGFIAMGITHIFGFDASPIVGSLTALIMVVGRMDGFLYVVLALNRLKVMTKLQYPKLIHTTIVLFAWVYGISFIVYYTIPCCGIIMHPGIYLPSLDPLKPYNNQLWTIAGFIYEGTLCATFLIYVILVLFIGWKRKNSSSLSSFKKELNIVLYAVLKFLLNMALSVAFHYIPATPTTSVALVFTYIIKFLLVPPLLYLTLFRSARKDFFKRSRPVVASSGIHKHNTGIFALRRRVDQNY